MSEHLASKTIQPPRQLPQLLRRAWYGLNQAFRRRIAHTGITPDQYTVLRTVLENSPPGLTQRELSQAMSSDPNTVASLLERMTAAGWVERQPHESDRRAYRLIIQPEGRRLFEECRAIAVALQDEVLAPMPAAERERFLEQMSILSAGCRSAVAESPRPTRRRSPAACSGVRSANVAIGNPEAVAE